MSHINFIGSILIPSRARAGSTYPAGAIEFIHMAPSSSSYFGYRFDNGFVIYELIVVIDNTNSQGANKFSFLWILRPKKFVQAEKKKTDIALCPWRRHHPTDHLSAQGPYTLLFSLLACSSQWSTALRSRTPRTSGKPLAPSKPQLQLP